MEIIWGEPQAVELSCETIEQGFLPREKSVILVVDGTEYLAFVPDSQVNEAKNTLNAILLGKWPDGTFLVELPGETLTSGSKLRVTQDLLMYR